MTNLVKSEKTTAVATASFLDEMMLDATSNMTMGLESADASSFAIPFLSVVQTNSPICSESKPEYNPDAKAGMIFNTVSKKLYNGKTGVTIIPCYFKREFLLWGNRKASGGFKGSFDPLHIQKLESAGAIENVGGKLYVKDKDGSIDLDKADYYVDTRSHYILLVDDETGATNKMILSLSSSQVKKSRNLLTMLSEVKVQTPDGQKRTPPSFANLVKVTSTLESNDKGEWRGFDFQLSGLVQDANLYKEAKAFYESVASGDVKADFSKMDDAQPEESREF